MLFTDPIFLFYFLPLSLLALRVCSSAHRFTTAARIAIIVATLVFYGYGNILWPVLFFVVVGGIYLFTLPILISKSSVVRRVGVVSAIVYALAALALFKYLNWLVTLWPALSPIHALLLPYFGEEAKVLLPPGISLFCF